MKFTFVFLFALMLFSSGVLASTISIDYVDPYATTYYPPQEPGSVDVQTNDTASWCGYNLNSAGNVSLSGSEIFWSGDITSDSIEGVENTIIIYCNSTTGEVDSETVVFTDYDFTTWINSYSDTPDPVADGSDVQFSVAVESDSIQGTPIAMYVCSSDSATSSGCTDTTYCFSDEMAWTNPFTFTCNHTTSGTGIKNYYVFGKGGQDVLSLGGSNGTFEVVTPTISVDTTSPTNTTIYGANVWFNATTNMSALWCGYELDGAANVTLSNDSSTNWYVQNTTMTDGSHTAIIYCNSSASDLNSDTTYFTSIPSVPISVTISTPTNTTFNSTSMWFNATANVTATWCGYSLDATSNVTMGNSSDTAWYSHNHSMTTGSHSISFYCTSLAGDVGVASTDFTITVPTWNNMLVFNTSTTWTVPTNVDVISVLVVGGGGGCSGAISGGAGAGGLIWNTSYAVVAGNNITVTIGAGGLVDTVSGDVPYSGNDSIFGTLIALGGGHGAATVIYEGGDGGSGGGASRIAPGHTLDASQGHDGGGVGEECIMGSGGGGAGGIGLTPADCTLYASGADGGIGIDMSAYVGTGVGELGWFAGGGGGGARIDGSGQGMGGLGGGGNGEGNGSSTTNGTANTGGGGGGWGIEGWPWVYGYGGSGVVIVLYNETAAENVAPTLGAIYIDSDAGMPAVVPTESGYTIVNVSFDAMDVDENLNDTSAYASITGITNSSCAASVINSTSMNYQCDLSVPYNMSGGLKNVTVYVCDDECEIATDSNHQFDYGVIYVISINDTSINLGTDLSGDDNLASDVQRITNAGNANCALTIQGANMTKDAFIISANGVSVDDDSTHATGETELHLTEAAQDFTPGAGLLVDGMLDVYWFIDIPALQPKGVYTSQVDLEWVSAALPS